MSAEDKVRKIIKDFNKSKIPLKDKIDYAEDLFKSGIINDLQLKEVTVYLKNELTKQPITKKEATKEHIMEKKNENKTLEKIREKQIEQEADERKKETSMAPDQEKIKKLPPSLPLHIKALAWGVGLVGGIIVAILFLLLIHGIYGSSLSAADFQIVYYVGIGIAIGGTWDIARLIKRYYTKKLSSGKPRESSKPKNALEKAYRAWTD